METTFAQWASIPPSGERITQDIPLTRARTLSVTCRVTYHAAATLGARVVLYFSPDGDNWDTVPVDYVDVDLTAGATVQETGLVAVPEHGWVRLGVFNRDTTQAVTDVSLWYTIQSWKDRWELVRGAEVLDVGETPKKSYEAETVDLLKEIRDLLKKAE